MAASRTIEQVWLLIPLQAPLSGSGLARACREASAHQSVRTRILFSSATLISYCEMSAHPLCLAKSPSYLLVIPHRGKSKALRSKAARQRAQFMTPDQEVRKRLITFSRSSNRGGNKSRSRCTTASSETAPPVHGRQLGRSRLMGATRESSAATCAHASLGR